MRRRVVYLLGAGATIDFGGPKVTPGTGSCHASDHQAIDQVTP